MERFTHVLEECAIRNLPYGNPAITKAMHAPQSNSPKVVRGLKKLRAKTWPEPILVKFGSRQHMTSLFLEGRGRISLAKTYADPTFGRARADDESLISVYVDPNDAHRLFAVEQFENGSRMIDLNVPYLGSFRVDCRANSDFYVYCMAESCDVRMFDDFTTDKSDVNTCVVITRPEEFKERLKAAIAKKLPGWKPVDGPIFYIDPFFASVERIVPQFCKHLRFAYQKEYRTIWLPPPAERFGERDHIYFDIGPLTDCAKLVWL
jgi:hypothetical protein